MKKHSSRRRFPSTKEKMKNFINWFCICFFAVSCFVSASNDLQSLLQGVSSDPEEAKQMIQQLVNLIRTPDENTGCACVGYNCGCCLDLSIKEIGLDNTVCANFSYLPAPEYGISLTLSLDGKVFLKETVSARNPPPICVDIPELKKLASLCIRFYDLAIADKKFSGCVKIEARLAGVHIEDVKLGCFKIPPTDDETLQLPGDHLTGKRRQVPGLLNILQLHDMRKNKADSAETLF